MSDLPPPELVAPPASEPETIPSEPVLPPLLEKIPFPKPVLAFAAITVLAFAFGAARAPHAIQMGINAERGKRALAAGDSAKAISLLRPIVKEFPKAEDVTIDLIDADIIDGDLQEAVKLVEPFEGKEVDKDQKERLDSIASELNVISGEIEAQEAKDAKEAKEAKDAKKGKPGQSKGEAKK